MFVLYRIYSTLKPLYSDRSWDRTRHSTEAGSKQFLTFSVFIIRSPIDIQCVELSHIIAQGPWFGKKDRFER